MSEQVKVTINPPSEQVIAKAGEEVSVTDSRGRVIRLKKPGVLAQYRMIEALGESAKNEVYTAMVLPLIFVTAIDSEIVYQPSTKREIEALIQMLDEEGISAVVSSVQSHFGATDPEADKAALKK